MNARMEALTKLSDRFDWFDIYNDEHLLPIDERLNQAPLVGACVELLSSTKQYVYGETIVQAVIGLIPRVIWPSKPMRAGSGDLVSRFTGIEFAEGTSVGIGQIMEFHANGGTVFVVIGMFLFGILLGVADQPRRNVWRVTIGRVSPVGTCQAWHFYNAAVHCSR